MIVAGCFAAAGPVIYWIARGYNRRLGIDTNPPNPVEMVRAAAAREAAGSDPA